MKIVRGEELKAYQREADKRQADEAERRKALGLEPWQRGVSPCCGYEILGNPLDTYLECDCGRPF